MTSSYPIIKGTLVSTENYTWNTADSLGKGASAIVYLGRDKREGTVVAVKQFHDYVHETDLRELELLQKLRHDNIIKFLAIERMPPSMRSVLIMEFCEGGSLHHMLDQPLYFYGLSEEEFLLVLFHVSEGMEYLRKENVIHRDIKPGNIMRFITGDGDSIYKLTDFGAARSLDEDETFQSLYGTEEYLHPGIYERAVLRLPTAQSFNATVDLWSLGVTFYHTATGQLPFQAFGGRSNKQTMYKITTQKETGVISGVQETQDGPITWKKDLPETSPLSSGLKAIVIPLLAGLMEPDSSRMLTYDSLFRMVSNIKSKLTINIFHYSHCEDLKIYVDKTVTLTELQDQIASLTDIAASEQILLVGGKLLQEVVDPMAQVQSYPPHLLHSNIYLFQKEMNEVCRPPKPPDTKDFPEFHTYSEVLNLSDTEMDEDSRLAHTCCARGELIKRYTESVSQQQEKLMDGLLCLRMHLESRVAATKSSQHFMKQLMDECHSHFVTLINLVQIFHNIISSGNFNPAQRDRDLAMLKNILDDRVIRQVNAKAQERINEIEQYRDMLVKKVEDIKDYASNFAAICKEEKCYKKSLHHMSVISGIQSRFRRDKSVKLQMTQHDKNIHRFERKKLEKHCFTMKSILTEHCLPNLEKVFKNGLHTCESLTKCIARIGKVEKNIKSVLNCQSLLSEKIVKLRSSVETELRTVTESGFESRPLGVMEIDQESSQNQGVPETGGAAAMAEVKSLGSGSQIIAGGDSGSSRQQANLAQEYTSMSEHSQKLVKELNEIHAIVRENTEYMHSHSNIDGSLSSNSGSFRKNAAIEYGDGDRTT